jgi:hypothetical protein
MIKSQTTKSIPIHVDKNLKVQNTSNKLEMFFQELQVCYWDLWIWRWKK